MHETREAQQGGSSARTFQQESNNVQGIALYLAIDLTNFPV